MTVKRLNSPAENARVVSSNLPAAAAATASDVDDDNHRHHDDDHSAMPPVNRVVDPWLLPQLADDESPHWNGMSHLNHALRYRRHRFIFMRLTLREALFVQLL